MAAQGDQGLHPLPASSKPKQTCAQCRARKVKCDGRLELCSNCERLGYACSFGASSTDGSYGTVSSASGLSSRPSKGRRVPRACRECHLAKSRCSGALPSCQRCTGKGVQCIYEPRADSRRRHLDSTSPLPALSQSSIDTQSPEDVAMSQPSALQISTYEMFDAPPAVNANSGYHQQYPLLTRERVLPAIRKFFDQLYRLPSLAFLHRPSFMRLYHSQEADPALLAAIVAVTSRLPGTTAEESSIGFRCADITEGLLNGTLLRPSFFRLQALLLLLRFRLWTGSLDDPLILMAHLSRSAFLLRLNYETFRPSSYVQEARRRLMWAIYILDVSLGDGLPEYRACSINSIHLRLPCMEDDFELDTDTLSEKVTYNGAVTPYRVGIIGFFIRIVHLNDQILRYLKRLINLKCEPSPEKELLRLEEDLLAFQSRLPGHERYSQKTLSLRAFSPRLARFVMTHTWWHVCHCQLYRCLLPTIPETFSQRLFNIFGETAVAGYQNKCLEHAISAVSILTSFLELERDPCTFDMDMAECAFKIAEILLLSSESTRAQMGIGHAEILHHATGCLRFAESMLEMYPAIAPLISDMTSALQAFAQGEPCFTASPMAETSPKQAISKHSALYRASFVDDSYKLEIPGTSNIHTANPMTAGRNTTTQPATSTMPDGQDYGGYGGLTEALLGTRDSQDVFPWPVDVPDIWDQVSLFRGPFDSGELDSHASGPG